MSFFRKYTVAGLSLSIVFSCGYVSAEEKKQSGERNGSDEAASFNGSWSSDCEARTVLTINDDAAIMEVNSNQVYISLVGLRNPSGGIDFVLKQPEELGRGGMRLKWNEFSREKTVATFSLVEDGVANFNWLGFFNKKRSKYEWQAEPDFMQDEKSNSFERCELK